MLLHVLVALVFAAAVFPAFLFLGNIERYHAPFPERRLAARTQPRVSVLIPARNEEAHIAECLKCVLASRGVGLEVTVLDDASTDRTAEIVREMAREDSRLQLAVGLPLPAGWNGKQHACWQLAQMASEDLLLFLDADVRIAPHAIAQCVTTLRRTGVELLSGFPRQITVGFVEAMLIPLIHFVLLSFLPLGRMRRSTNPAYAAGCGQFLLVEHAPYFFSGGHLAIRETRHDGLRLPQVLRQHGLRTDLVDLTDLAEVRMYDSARAVWQGLAKNATEGLAAPLRIVPITLLLLLGQVAPLALVLWLVTHWHRIHERNVIYAFALLVAFAASYAPRLLASRRFRQPLYSALLHPLGVLLLLLVQWQAFLRQLIGRPVQWRQRSYSTNDGGEVG
jgi:glycosyltransferase involved in cell wall biosynthesis